MQEALSLARRAAQVGEVPVGAVVVKDGVATARAYNTRQQSKNPTAHAEILVIQRASIVTGDWRLTDTTLYVTLEPCPMCAGAILATFVGPGFGGFYTLSERGMITAWLLDESS